MNTTTEEKVTRAALAEMKVGDELTFRCESPFSAISGRSTAGDYGRLTGRRYQTSISAENRSVITVRRVE